MDELYELLRLRIITCDLPPGAVLSQVQLAEELDVHRTALREALRMLQRERLVVSEYNRRVRITNLTSGELEELYAMRILHESTALRIGVGRFEDEELARLDWLVDAMQEPANAAEFARRDMFHREFHAILVSRAGSRIAETAKELADYCERYRRHLVQQRPTATFAIAAAEHAAIADACTRRDADEAGRLLARHLGRAAVSLSSISDPSHDPAAVREALRVMNAGGPH